jgi:hypothetical protein
MKRFLLVALIFLIYTPAFCQQKDTRDPNQLIALKEFFQLSVALICQFTAVVFRAGQGRPLIMRSQQVIPSPFLIAADAPWRHCTLIEIDCLKVIPALSLACTVSRWVPVANVMSASSDFVFVV